MSKLFYLALNNQQCLIYQKTKPNQTNLQLQEVLKMAAISFNTLMCTIKCFLDNVGQCVKSNRNTSIFKRVRACVSNTWFQCFGTSKIVLKFEIPF